mgnify:CR=1 FL=1|jgi:hypothetical protein|tara:strand:+ start:1708 stop:1887 length:180 start_codon:yes stop_codon:yes gene_type:complete
MPITLEELKEQVIATLDEELICEMLSISTSDLVDAFEDRILKNFDKIAEEFEQDEDEIK